MVGALNQTNPYYKTKPPQNPNPTFQQIRNSKTNMDIQIPKSDLESEKKVESWRWSHGGETVTP